MKSPPMESGRATLDVPTAAEDPDRVGRVGVGLAEGRKTNGSPLVFRPFV